MGVHPRQVYSVLDVREVKTTDAKGNRDSYKLIRLMLPWAGCVEWKGACSDTDENFWTEETKGAFSNSDKHDPAAAERPELLSQRFIHDWTKTDDGVFAMRIEDFMTYFNQLTVLRDLAPSYTEFQYNSRFSPSYGALTNKTQEWLQNKQYTFTFSAPLQLECRVNILLEQVDMRMLESRTVQPPYSAKMPQLGLIVLEMSKAMDEVKHYEPSKRVIYIRPQGRRHIQASFMAGQKRYCVIPCTEKKGWDGLEYKLTLQFGAKEGPDYITHGSKYKDAMAPTQIPDAKVIKAYEKKYSNKTTRAYLTPFALDEQLNKRDGKRPKLNSEAARDSMIENVRMLLASETIFEDEAVGMF